MTNGDDEPDAPATDTDDADAAEAAEAIEEPDFDELLADAQTALEDAQESPDEDTLDAALDAIEHALEAASTEADLDEVEAIIEDAGDVLESAELPAPDEDEEDAEDPRDALESHFGELETGLEDARGPYAADVTELIETVIETVEETRWTNDGTTAVVEVAESFQADVGETLDTSLAVPGSLDDVGSELNDTITGITEAALDPDDDASTINTLLEAADTLETGVEEAEAWDDLSTREQLQAEGFFDVLGHHKDYPPEWSALKEHEKRGNADMILLALDKLGSEFYEEHCLDALRRMGPEEALDPMLERAGRRDRPAIEILGKIGHDDAVDTIVEYVGEDSDPLLEQTTLQALGEIGSADATQKIANRLVAENDAIRSHAARALGMIGDPRAVNPLTTRLQADDADEVRASAAWALNQIGTEAALSVVSEYADDRTYLVQAEAEKATTALG